MAIQIETSFQLEGYIESLIGGRNENQDSAGAMETPIGTIIVVCDGMGGMNGGKMASMLAVKAIIDKVAEAKKDDDPEHVLIGAFQHAQNEILSKSYSNPELKGMGTTATAIIIAKQYATVAHIGDSRIYQLRRRKKVFRTNDHSMVYQLVDSGVLTEEQARLSANSNIILKALGIEGDATPDVMKLPYLRGDRFILCTDGFWSVYEEKKFIKLISRRGNLNDVLWDATKEINKQGIIAGGSHDNLTAAVFDMNCESKLKPHMSRRLKVTLLFIIVSLITSICMNIMLINRFEHDYPRLEAAKEYASALIDSTKTTNLNQSKVKFIDAFYNIESDIEEISDSLN